jgi:dTDP-4-amino-4,6-dideoxygalactose transaminase
MNYEINDPWDWVDIFENTVAQYAGSKYAIACDSNSNAIRLLLHYLNIKNKEIEIPARTYVSVPNQIILSGNKPKFVDTHWDGMYELGDTNVVDAATAFHQGMYNEFKDSYMVLSFHAKKILNIGKGGMILTNDDKFEKWARPMIYDGRDKRNLYKDDEFSCVGWHMYMTPEDAARGMSILHSNKIQLQNKTVGGSSTYMDLRDQPIFKQYQ